MTRNLEQMLQEAAAENGLSITKGDLKKLLKLISDEGCNPHEEIDYGKEIQYFECLKNAVYYYIYSATSLVLKRNRWNVLKKCLESISKKYPAAPQEECWGIPSPPDGEPSVQFVKLLHDRGGITDSQLTEKLKISKRQVAAYRNALSLNKADQDNQKKGLSFAGQKMMTEINTIRCDGHEKKYVTENTLHPVALQMNLAQAGILLASLQKYRDDSNYSIGYTVALDVWYQLSDYGKMRIREIFCPQNDGLAAFLDELDDDIKCSRTLGFVSESEMSQSGYTSIYDDLMIAFKSGALCSLRLKQNGEILCLHNVRIVYRDGKYLAVSAENKIFKNYPFEKDDVYEIIMV